MSKIFGFIIGPSGIGKDYGLGRVLREYWGVRTFVTGDWCRKYATNLAANGILVNDQSLVLAGIEDYWSADSPDYFLFDCPRTVEQVTSMINFFRDQKMTQLVTWSLVAQRSICEDRIRERAMRQGRADDAEPEVIARRLDTYFGVPHGIQCTVLPYLAEESRLIHVDASVDLEDVRTQVYKVHAPSVYGACIKPGALVH